MPIDLVQQAILMVRGQRVLLDSDLARIYRAQTKNLTRAVKLNVGRFPEDLMFQLSREEMHACFYGLRCG